MLKPGIVVLDAAPAGSGASVIGTGGTDGARAAGASGGISSRGDERRDEWMDTIAVAATSTDSEEWMETIVEAATSVGVVDDSPPGGGGEG